LEKVSLLLNCPTGDPQKHLALLGISSADVSTYAEPSPTFLAQHRNGALLSAASGAFTHAVDVFLYSAPSGALDDVLREISCQGVDVAMPFPEDSDPEVYQYWHMGQARTLRVVDIGGELMLVDPLGGQGLA
jgi:hypothetical protein